MGQVVYTPPASSGGVGTGNVTGPAGATDSAIALYDGATGQLIKNSVVTIDGAGNIRVNGQPLSLGSADPGDSTTIITVDNPAGNAGDVLVDAGDSTGGGGDGGNVVLAPGEGDGAGVDGGIVFQSPDGSSEITFHIDNSTVSYELTWPLAAGAAGTYLRVDGVGQMTWELTAFTGDSGLGGVAGFVPAPAVGDAALKKFLMADGTWAQVTAGDIVPAFEIASYTKTAPNGSQTLYERGDELGAGLTAIAATYISGPPTAATINNSGVPAFGQPNDQSPAAWTIAGDFLSATQPNAVQRGEPGNGLADPTWTFQLDADKGTENDLANLTVTWSRRLYYGQDASGAVATQAGMQGLTVAVNVIDQNKAISFSLTCANEYVYYAVPTDYGTPTFTVNGFSGGFSLTTAGVSFDTLNAAALASTYNIWRSDNLLTGSINFVVT